MTASKGGTAKAAVYTLQTMWLGSSAGLTLSETEFLKLKKARNCLNAASALEESYDLLLENYRELEVAVLTEAVYEMTAMRHEYSDFFDLRTLLNRRVVNVLAAARKYLDQYVQQLSEAGLEANEVELVKSKSSAAYDHSFGYRFMHALRNHALHNGLAVYGVTVNGRWLPKGEEAKELHFTITPYALKAALETDSKFKKTVLVECSEKVFLLPAVRDYVGGISAVHMEARARIAPLVDAARDLFQTTSDRFKMEKSPEDIVSLSAIAKVMDEHEEAERIPILLAWEDVRQRLVKKNAALSNLNQRFVSNQCEK